jgi:hypothetical protein
MKLKDMTRDGVFISKEDQAKAIHDWVDVDKTPFMKAWTLDGRVHAITGSKTCRIGDALIQKMRKTGVIEFDGSKWHLTDDYADNIHDHIDTWMLT